MNPPVVLFQVEASAAVGMGHLARTRTLARALRERGGHAAVIGPSHAYRKPGDEDLFAEWIEAEDWRAGRVGAAALLDVARRLGASRIVFDDYRVDPEFGAALAAAGLVFLQQFDASRPRDYYANMIAHGGLAEADKARFAPYLRRTGARMLFGPAYAVLRPEFPPPSRDRSGIFVSFGGGDDRGAVRFCLEALDSAAVTVMSGGGNPNNDAISRWVDAYGKGRVTLEIDPADVAGLYAGADIAILGGGTSTFEAACSGVPMILIALEDNQVRQCEVWRDLGAAVYLGRRGDVGQAALKEAVRALSGDAALRARMGATGRNAVDGQGAGRLLDEILKG